MSVFDPVWIRCLDCSVPLFGGKFVVAVERVTGLSTLFLFM